MQRRARDRPGQLPWRSAGRFTTTHLEHPGPDPVRLLLIADPPVLLDGHDTEQASIQALLTDLATRTGRGIRVDLLQHPAAVLPAFATVLERGWRNWRFDAVLVTIPPTDQARARRGLLALEQHAPLLPVATGVGRHRLPTAETLEPEPLSTVTGIVDAVTGTLAARPVPRLDAAEAARRAAVTALGPLAELSLRRLQPIALMAARTYELPHAMINILTGDQLVTIAAINAPLGVQPQISALCNQTIAAPGPNLIADTWQHPALIGDPIAHGPAPVRFYAGHPLRTPDGHSFGSICVYDTQPHNADDLELHSLRDLALLAEAELTTTT